MAASTLITDYIGYGTHAARPASPTLPSGGMGLYLESDTGCLFIWNGSIWVAATPSLVAALSLTAQTASIGVTNLYLSPPVGLYRVTGAIQLTTAGTSGTVSASITYQDINSNSQTDTLISAVTFGSLNNRGSGQTQFWATPGAAIQYSTTVASAVGSPVYAAEFSVEKIG